MLAVGDFFTSYDSLFSSSFASVNPYAAEYQFSSDNIDRVDIPKYAVTTKFLAPKQELFIGDTVTVVDRDNGITSKQRVTMVDIYPNSPEKNNFQAGKASISINDAWETTYMAAQYLRLRKNGAGQELKTSALEFMEKNEDVTVENKGDFQKIAKYGTGALFVSPDGNYAVAIIDGKVKVGERPGKNEADKYPDGWKWTGVFRQGQVTVNEVFTGTLFTNLCTVMSENGKLEIKDSLITMYDKNNRLRFESGYNGTQYIFALYDETGKKSLYMDDNGNLTMTGVFKTGEDGARLVIDKNGINSYNNSGQLDGIVMNPVGFWSNFNLYRHGRKCFTVDMEEATGAWTIHCLGYPVIVGKSTGGGLRGTWEYGGTEIATKADIQFLQNQINALKGL